MKPRKSENENGYLQSFIKGEERGYDFIFRQHFTSLCFFVNKILHDEADAKDIVQDCFVRLWGKHTILLNPESIKSFLYTSVKNASLNFLRNKQTSDKRVEEISNYCESNNDNWLDKVTHAEMMNEIYLHIQSLPPRMQEVFRKLFIDGKSCNEIASELHTDPSTVRQQKARALQLLREKLGASIRSILFFL